MFRYLLRRLVTSIPAMIGVSILIFLAVRLVPGAAITLSPGAVVDSFPLTLEMAIMVVAIALVIGIPPGLFGPIRY